MLVGIYALSHSELPLVIGAFRKDKSAVGWDHKEAPQKHENTKQVGTNYTKLRPVIAGAKSLNLRAKFENLAKSTKEDTRKRDEEQERLRDAKDNEAARQAVAENKPQQGPEENRIPPAKGVRTTIVTGRQGNRSMNLTCVACCPDDREILSPYPLSSPEKQNQSYVKKKEEATEEETSDEEQRNEIDDLEKK
uniref:Uncharacterized protein n=1 Tax=Glossina palpalis gambiensis TaxID=67801 RepID=A0A1B0BPN4_9MUSC